MKKNIFLSLLIACGFFAKSQILISLLLGDKLNSPNIEFGLAGGTNLATIQGLKDAKYKALFNLGFYFDFKFKNPKWLFNTGVMVKSTMGAGGLPAYSVNNPNLDSTLSGGTVVRRIHYFNVPVMLRYKFKFNLFLNAGILAGLKYKAQDDFTNSVKETDDLKYRYDIKENYKPLDVGPIFGLGYRLMGGQGMNLGVYYYAGLVNIQMDNTLPKQYNRSIFIMVGIPIGAGKENTIEIKTHAKQ